MAAQGKILIVEDNESFLKTLVHFFKDNGYDVEGALDGKKAVELAKKHHFDIIVADARLPGGMDGIEVAGNIKRNNPNARISTIIITGYPDTEAPIRAIKTGVDDYLRKPFQLQELAESVTKSLKIRKAEIEREENISRTTAAKDELEKRNHLLEQSVRGTTDNLALLLGIGREITSSLKLDDVLDTIVERIANVLDVERCSILLLDEQSGELFIAAAKGLPQEVIEKTRIKIGEEISGWILEHKEPVLVKDIEKDNNFAKNNEERYYTGSFVSVALIFNDKAIGVINVNNKHSREAFCEDDLKIVKGIADQASIAIENARLYSNLQGVYLQVIATLTSVIEIKDHYTKRHSERVTKYAVSIAKTMGLPRSDVEVVEIACRLHDLGKIAVHEHILTKPGKLTKEEFEEIKLHPLKGVEILKPLTFLNKIMKLVEQHHERYDGKGYPYGQKAKDIDLGARIMAVADSYDAMTTDRPYARALSNEEAIKELKQCSGSQFDPQIVDVFIEILNKAHKQE